MGTSVFRSPWRLMCNIQEGASRPKHQPPARWPHSNPKLRGWTHTHNLHNSMHDADKIHLTTSKTSPPLHIFAGMIVVHMLPTSSPQWSFQWIGIIAMYYCHPHMESKHLWYCPRTITPCHLVPLAVDLYALQASMNLAAFRQFSAINMILQKIDASWSQLRHPSKTAIQLHQTTYRQKTNNTSQTIWPLTTL